MIQLLILSAVLLDSTLKARALMAESPVGELGDERVEARRERAIDGRCPRLPSLSDRRTLTLTAL